MSGQPTPSTPPGSTWSTLLCPLTHKQLLPSNQSQYTQPEIAVSQLFSEFGFGMFWICYLTLMMIGLLCCLSPYLLYLLIG